MVDGMTWGQRSTPDLDGNLDRDLDSEEFLGRPLPTRNRRSGGRTIHPVKDSVKVALWNFRDMPTVLRLSSGLRGAAQRYGSASARRRSGPRDDAPNRSERSRLGGLRGSCKTDCLGEVVTDGAPLPGHVPKIPGGVGPVLNQDADLPVGSLVGSRQLLDRTRLLASLRTQRLQPGRVASLPPRGGRRASQGGDPRAPTSGVRSSSSWTRRGGFGRCGRPGFTMVRVCDQAGLASAAMGVWGAEAVCD